MPLGTPTLFGTPVDSGTAGGADDITFTVPGGGVAAGTLLIVCANWSPNSSSIDAVSDSRSNSYSVAVSRTFSGGSNVGAAICYSYLTTTLQAADTIVVSFTAFSGVYVSVYTVTGADSSPLDKTASAQMDFATAYSSGNTAATTVADELLFGINSTNEESASGAFTPTGSFNELDDVATTSPSCRFQTQYRIVSATGAYASTATCASNNDGVALIATFKQGGPAVAQNQLAWIRA